MPETNYKIGKEREDCDTVKGIENYEKTVIFFQNKVENILNSVKYN